MPGGKAAGLPVMLAALLLSACAPEAQQATSVACAIPEELTPKNRATPPDNIPDAPTTGYVLALSWSPEFCRFRAGQAQHDGQCADNRFGFILHGLWPQAGAGPHPRSCARAAPVPLETLRENYCMMPSAELMHHEWAAHGTCGWASADAYFDSAAQLWAAIARPNLFTLSRQPGLTAADIRTAFAAANPGLEREAVGVRLNGRGWLEEVFLCLDLNEKPRGCTTAEYGARDQVSVSIWRGGGRTVR